MGTFAVQIAAALGATVDGIAGTENLALVRSLGADRVFDHRDGAHHRHRPAPDLIIDCEVAATGCSACAGCSPTAAPS
ncbi:MAG: zinc-binding dehydrogenase [Acidimicrobiales bacterium]